MVIGIHKAPCMRSLNLCLMAKLACERMFKPVASFEWLMYHRLPDSIARYNLHYWYDETLIQRNRGSKTGNVWRPGRKSIVASHESAYSISVAAILGLTFMSESTCIYIADTLVHMN